MVLKLLLILQLYIVYIKAASTCRERNNHVRQDGGMCFEIPPWQHQPVELEHHVARLRTLWGVDPSVRRQMPVMVNSEISRAMDTILAPFLDTYHRNIQNSYQLMTTKMLNKNKDEIASALQRKQHIYNNLTALADKLKVTDICMEERRKARTIANKHVADQFLCTEGARASISKMGKYAEEMILITKNHMQSILDDANKGLGMKTYGRNASNVTSAIQVLSRAAVALGYELDLSLTNARRHNEQSCEHLNSCTSLVKKETDNAVAELTELIYQCVYA